MNAITKRWKESVCKSGEQQALFYNGKFRSYREIDGLVEYYASLIPEQKSKVVGVMMENSDRYIVAILSILRKGYTFVPIDITYPDERIKYIIRECSIDLLMIDNAEWVCDYAYTLLVQQLDEYCVTTEAVSDGPNEVAYILYTSGTTGTPKGIKISHEAVGNLVTWFDETYGIQNNCNVLQMANNTFDVSIEEIFGCILNGGTLYIPKTNERVHYNRMREFIIHHKINIIQSVPIVLKELLLNGSYMDCVNVVISGGEALGDSLKDQIIQKGYNLYNHYGPTETTVDCLTTKCEIGKKVTLGKPISNCRCFIINKENEVVEDGTWGELCCAGINLSLGYVCGDNNEKFITIGGERVYKTGDWCYINEDEEVVYGGRIDNLVKLKGRRIELEEINSCLMRMQEVYFCTSIVVEDRFGGKIITFYSADIAIEKNYLNSYLSALLPEYMIPSDYIFVEKFEQNNNSKVDVKRLREFYLGQEKLKGKVFAGNRLNGTEEELDIISIIGEILCISEDSLSRETKLQDIGMDSLSYVKLVVALEDKYDFEFEDDVLTIKAFETISDLGKYVNKNKLGEENTCVRN